MAKQKNHPWLAQGAGLARHGLGAILLSICGAPVAWMPPVPPEWEEDVEPVAAPDGDPRIEIGRWMYREGVLPSGDLMLGTLMGDVKLSGAQVICVACHRRSGLGSVEGQEVVPPVTEDILYNPLRVPTSKPPLAPLLRPAYDDESLKRAIRDGVGSDGKPLGVLMPRYPLSDADLDPLIAYLQTLKSSPSPGVTERDMHFATLIAGPVDPDRRKAFLDVLETFFEQKNRETRHESDRSAQAPWHKAWVFKPYRKWVLHVWELEGAPESWPAQFAASYADQPVFAVISGLSAGDWGPVHAFCEDQELPCLFPNTDVPVVNDGDFYSLYLSRGMALEADAVAQHLADEGLLAAPIVQVHGVGDLRAETAAARLRAQLAGQGGQVIDMIVGGATSPVDKTWSTALMSAPEVAVLWLDRAALGDFWTQWAADPVPGPRRVYLSTSLYGTEPAGIPPELRDQVYLVHPSALPSQLPRLLGRASAWLRMKGISSPDSQAVQANTFFALKMAGQAAKGIRGFFNRDYFIERIEHMAENATYTSVYPAVSLAPGQRFVSRGAYIARFEPAATGAALVAVTDWLVPGGKGSPMPERPSGQ